MLTLLCDESSTLNPGNNRRDSKEHPSIASFYGELQFAPLENLINVSPVNSNQATGNRIYVCPIDFKSLSMI